MKNFHIEIDVNKDGDVLIREDECAGEHYHISGGVLDDLIDQFAACLVDYLRDQYDDTDENNMAFSPDSKPNNIMSTDGELKQWQKDIMERGCIMSRAEMQEFLKPKNDITEKAKLQKNSLYGKTVRENDPVNHPSHYTDGKIEVIDFIEDKKLNFHLANAVKYISRAGKKDPSKEIEDLKKARWYLDRYIQKLESDNAPTELNGSDTDGDEWRTPFPKTYLDQTQINKCENKEGETEK